MRLLFFTFALLGLTAIGGHASSNSDSNITFFGAPRASLDGVLPVLSIEEDYIRGQTDGISNGAFGAADPVQCSVSSPCADGSCCNSQGMCQCGFRDEHCKNSCVANCDAKAPCGLNSEGGSQTCPLNVCCSYFGFCGATESFCRDATDSGQSTPCQKQFGKCGTITPPICGTGSGTASRRVAYYEGWNTRRRPCDKVYPENIDTTGLTHLIFSFATIDPETFAVAPMHPDDEKLYTDFLSLQDGSQKWIGIGGWEFSDAGATRYTWSRMASSKANREAFIASLLTFLDKWDFQGVDIDWEWPGAESRGGNPTIDMRNQIDLMVELRKSLGSRGLSIVLPAQYEYLKNLDPKALEAQVDHFNILSYDLHGPWDATVPSEGAFIKPHTDLQEIDAALNLFWFNDVNPAKINLGIANYGRGYTVADESCAKYGCAWTGPSEAGECTQLEGVLSQCEIQRLINVKKLSPEIIAGGAAVKKIIFDNQWVGYDDEETLNLKMGLANNRCLGGTALWAIDYASCGGDPGSPVVPSSSSAAPSSSTPSSSAPVESVAPSSEASSAPTTSSEPAPSSAPTTATTSTAPAASSATASAPASSVSPPVSSAPLPASASTSAGKTSAEPSTSSLTTIPVVPSEGTTAPGSSIPASQTTESSVAWSTEPFVASSTAGVTPPLSQTSESGSSAPVTDSSAAQVSSGASATTSSQASSSDAPPIVIVPSTGSSQPLQSSQPSTATISTSAQVSSVVPSSSGTASQGNSTSTFLSSSESSALTSSIVSSSAPASASLTWISSNSSAGQSSSWSTSEPTSTAGTLSITSGVSITSGTSFSLSMSATTTNATSNSTASPTGTGSSVDSTFGQSSAAMSSQAQSSQASWSTEWSSTEGSSAAMTSGTQAPSDTITSDPTASTSGASATQTGEHTSDDDDGTTGVGPVPPATQPSGNKPDPTKEPDSNPTEDPDADPTTKPDDDPTTTPAPGETDKPDPTDTGGGTVPTPPNVGAPTSTLKPIPTPVAPGLMKGCVPNDCIADCISWYALSLLLTKRPFCPCKVVTCKPDDDEDDWTDNDSDGEDDDCGLFGCGCGFLGLPFGPGCDIDIDFPGIFPGGIFGPEPCKLFGGCPPNGPPPDDNKPGGDNNDDDCGPLGCGGYCNIPGGCPPCPSEICSGPQCTIPGGCGPKPGPNPTPLKTPTGCRKEDEVTVTEKIVHCTENIKLEPTSIQSINFTLTTTLTSLCITPVLVTHTGCGLMGTSTTTTHSSFTSTSSSAPMCSRAPLDLDNDEGDNEQPTTTTDGPSCTRAPLSLDDDEGDNEMPADMSSSLWASFTPTPSANSSSIASSTSTPTTSESANFTSSSMSQVSSSSTLSMSLTLPPWGTGIPTGTPTPGNCGGCKTHFDELVKMKCQPDGSDADACAKWSLAALCYGSDSPDYCKTGVCKHSACPKQNPGDFSKGEPAAPFTTTLTLSSTTIPVTVTPAPSTTLSLSASPTPTCKTGGSVSPHGKWTAHVEQEIQGNHDASFAWTLWDENGCEAGKGSASNNQILGADIITDIGAQGRPQEQMMGYMLHANVSDSTSPSTSELLFTISKPPAGCTQMCWARWKIANGLEANAWQITDDCAPQCGSRKFGPTDVSCDGGMNKFQQTDDGNLKKRGGYCWWRMPFEPANDDPPPPKPQNPTMDRNSKWTVKIHQEMQYEDSSIEWWLIDQNGNEAGHGKATEHARVKGSWLGRVTIEDQGREDDPANQMPYKVTMMVSEPTNKDKSRVWFQMPNKSADTGCGELSEQCKAYIVTETDDESSPMYFRDCAKYCDDKPLITSDDVGCTMSGAFKKKNAGYERDFECWWHGVWRARDEDALSTWAASGGALGIGGGMNGAWVNSTWA